MSIDYTRIYMYPYNVFDFLEDKMPEEVVNKIKLFCYDSIIIRNSDLKLELVEHSIEIHKFNYRMKQAKKYCRMNVKRRQREKVKQLMALKEKRLLLEKKLQIK